MLLPIDIHFISVVSNGIRFSDQGIDIGMPCGTPVVAVSDGAVVFSGPARSSDRATAAAGGSDAPCTVILKFAKPLVFEGKAYSWARYENLDRIDLPVPGADESVEVTAGCRLGRSGISSGIPHLTFSLLADENGSPGRALPREALQRLLWRDVAQDQLGFSPITR